MGIPVYGYVVFSAAQAYGLLALAIAKGQKGRQQACLAAIRQFEQGGIA